MLQHQSHTGALMVPAVWVQQVSFPENQFCVYNQRPLIKIGPFDRVLFLDLY